MLQITYLLFKIGKPGAFGKGGYAGNQSRNGLTTGIIFRDRYNMSTGELTELGKPITMINETDMENITASNGIDGFNEVGIELPNSVQLTNPSSVIIDFKNFVREFLTKNSDQRNLEQFLIDLDKNEQILSLYDTLGFVNELKDLGNQYIELRDSLSFVPYLESLRERIGKYSEVSSDQLENKAILRWLHIEVSKALNKLNNAKSKEQITAVTNLAEYLEVARQNVIKFVELENEVSINKQQNEYQKFLEEQIELAVETIKTQIIPKMESIFIEINSQVFELIDELVERQYKYEIIELDQDIVDQLPPPPENETVMSFGPPDLNFSLKTLGTILNAFYSAANKMNQMIVENRPEDLNIHENILTSLNEQIKEPKFQYKNTLENEYKLLLKQLSDIEAELEKISHENISFDISGIKKKISESKVVLIAKVESSQMENATEINQIRRDLKIYMKDKQTVLGPTHGLSSLFEVILAVLDFENIPIHFYEQISLKHIEKILNIVQQYPSMHDKSEKRRIEWEYYLKYVYNQIIWRFEEMEVTVEEVNRNLTKHSYIELDIIKWKAQMTIRDVNAFFRRIGNETLVKETVYRTIEKLEDSVAVLIDTYNRIDLMNTAKSVNLFAGNVFGKSQYSSDSLLNEAVLSLKYMIQMYLIFEQHEIAMNAFKQHQFPFANIYLSRFELPTGLKGKDIQSIAREIVDHIDYMKEKVTVLESTIANYDHLIFEDAEFSSSTMSLVGPFFKWTKADIGDKLENLLKGEEIELEAKIVKSPALSAIKFNEIGVYFKNADQNKQKSLDSALQDGSIIMSMVGKTNYRCANKIYTFAGDESVVISHSFKRDPNGKPLLTNKVYKKLNQMQPFLSPYTTWKLKLTNNKNAFATLKDYADDTVLELSGWGQYITHESIPDGICERLKTTSP